MARGTGHEELHDAFRLWGMMEDAAKHTVAGEQVAEGEGGKRSSEGTEEMAAGMRVHGVSKKMEAGVESGR